MSRDRIVTLVTEALAERGVSFRIKVHAACLTCRLRRICVDNLRPGFEYEVVEVRHMRHLCPLTRSKMVVVVVRPKPVKVALESRAAVEGLICSYTPIKCGERDCPHAEYCDSEALREGERVKVVRVIGRLDCPLGRSLFLAEVSPLPREGTRSGTRRGAP